MPVAALYALLFAASLGQSPRVIVVRAADANGAVTSGPAQVGFAATCAALRSARVPFLKATDPQIAAQGFSGVRVAIFVACKTLTPGGAARLTQFLASGGRAIFVQYLPAEAARAAGWPTPQTCAAAYDTIVLPSDRPFGFPASVPVRTSEVGVLASATGTLGLFFSSVGKRQPLAAIYLGGKVGFIACALVSADPGAAGALLRALIARYDAGLWQSLVPADASGLPLVDKRLTLADLLARVKVLSFPYAFRAMIAARKAQATLTQARDSLHQGMVDAALDLAAAARHAANVAFWTAWPSKDDELRGIWTCNDVPGSWQATAEALADARINVVFPYVASGSACYYQSSILPRATDAEDRDWLADALAACHARGIKVHVRLLGISCLYSTSDTVAGLSAASRLMVDDEGKTRRWLCPSSRPNRNAVIASCVEVVSKYPVDGIQIDYLRYPDEHCCLCPTCRAAYEGYVGHPVKNWPDCVAAHGPEAARFADFRRMQLDSLLGDCRSAILKARPGLPISAAVWVNWVVHREGIAQDWVAWLDRGLIDFACPMDYVASTSRFEHWAALQRTWAKSAPLCYGIGPGADGVGPFPPLNVAQQIGVARKNGQGWVLFNLTRGLLSDYLPPLSLGVSHDQASLPKWAGG